MDENEYQLPGRIIGIDYGRKRIGVAISDKTFLLARPLCTIAAANKLPQSVARVAEELTKYSVNEEYFIEEIVVGIPLMLSGKTGEMAQEVQEFVELLDAEFPAEVVVWDERLTSTQANRILKDGGKSRKKRAKIVDEVAAVIILQSYLDRKRISAQ